MTLTHKHVSSSGTIWHYNDVIMGAIASQITSLAIGYSTAYSGWDQRKHQSSAWLAFVRGIHRGPVNSPHKWPVMRKKFPFDDVIIVIFATHPYWIKFSSALVHLHGNECYGEINKFTHVAREAERVGNNAILPHDVIQWKHYPRYWPCLRGIHWTVTGGFPSKRPVTQNFEVFFNLCLNNQLNKQTRRWWILDAIALIVASL